MKCEWIGWNSTHPSLERLGCYSPLKFSDSDLWREPLYRLHYTKLDIHRHSALVWKIGSPKRELWVFHLKINFALQYQWIWNQMVPIKFGLEKEIIMFSNIFHSSLIIHRLVISQSQFASVISLSCQLCYLRSTQLINYVHWSEMESHARVLDATGNSLTCKLCHERWY